MRERIKKLAKRTTADIRYKCNPEKTAAGLEDCEEDDYIEVIDDDGDAEAISLAEELGKLAILSRKCKQGGEVVAESYEHDM